MSNQQPGSKYEDCPSCRIVGSATLATVGTYALWQSRASAPGSPGQRRVVAGLGLGMLLSITLIFLRSSFCVKLFLLAVWCDGCVDVRFLLSVSLIVLRIFAKFVYECMLEYMPPAIRLVDS
jgi:hypothetical protein